MLVFTIFQTFVDISRKGNGEGNVCGLLAQLLQTEFEYGFGMG